MGATVPGGMRNRQSSVGFTPRGTGHSDAFRRSAHRALAVRSKHVRPVVAASRHGHGAGRRIPERKRKAEWSRGAGGGGGLRRGLGPSRGRANGPMRKRRGERGGACGSGGVNARGACGSGRADRMRGACGPHAGVRGPHGCVVVGGIRTGAYEGGSGPRTPRAGPRPRVGMRPTPLPRGWRYGGTTTSSRLRIGSRADGGPWPARWGTTRGEQCPRVISPSLLTVKRPVAGCWR